MKALRDRLFYSLENRLPGWFFDFLKQNQGIKMLFDGNIVGSDPEKQPFQAHWIAETN